MATEIVPLEEPDGEDSDLQPHQVAALEKLFALGAEPRKPTDEKYHSNPQIRALQMVYEGKLGGPGRGQGRPTREDRISVQLTQYVREKLGTKVTKALERALNSSAGERINLDAIKLIVEMEHKEAKLQLTEDKADLDNLSKEELVATLFDLVGDAQTGQVIQATFTDLPTPKETVTAQVEREAAAETRRRDRERKRRKRAAAKRAARPPAVDRSERNGDSSSPSVNGADAPGAGGNGRGEPAADRPTHPNPVTQAALRRAARR